MDIKPEYYNEFNPDAAAWLRDLIKAGELPEGDVDERSIADVRPDDLKQYHRCHFFAGIGLWPYALRIAGFPADEPVWTGSCPCQPYSSAGKQKGEEDPRHLWPTWSRLISECKPPTVFGEQVAAAIGKGWLDLVQYDLESSGYAVGKAVLSAASVGAPHIRQRLYFVADTSSLRRDRGWRAETFEIQRERPERSEEHTRSEQDGIVSGGFEGLRGSSELAFSSGCGLRKEREISRRGYAGDGTQGWPTGSQLSSNSSGVALGDTDDTGLEGRLNQSGQHAGELPVGEASVTLGLAYDEGERRRETGSSSGRPEERIGVSGESGDLGDSGGDGGETGIPKQEQRYEGFAGVFDNSGDQLGWNSTEPTPVGGYWRDADWVWCRDLKYRPIEPSTFPLAYGLPRNLGSLTPDLQRLAEVAGLSKQSLLNAKHFRKSALHGYGNAIVPQVAAEFIGAYLESR